MSNGYLTNEEVEMYGEEFVGVMRKVAAETAARTAAPLNNEIHNLRQAVGSVQNEVGQAFLQRMDRELSAIAGDWQALNRHPPFIEWSKGLDVFSGRRRAELMQDAWNSGDARRVGEFFKAYAAEPNSTPPTQRSGYNFLPSGSPQRGERNLYTPDQISRFYRDVTAGRWANREQERRAIDADIQRASAEGRIVGANGRPVADPIMK